MSAPERIFLQWGDELPGAPDPYPDDVTWCADRVDENDVEYVNVAEVERERAIRKEAIRDNREKTEDVRELQAEVARLTALLKESDDTRVALKEHYPKLRSQLAAARAERDEGFRELARQHANITRELDEMRAMWDKDSSARHRLTADLAQARAERDGLAKALRNLVKMNVEHNEAVEAVIGRPLNWSDNYLDEARAALAAPPTPPKEEA